MSITPKRRLTGALSIATLAFGISALVTPAAQAGTARDGVCDEGEVCFYHDTFNTHGMPGVWFDGAVSDFDAGSDVPNYGASQPSCYEFKGSDTGAGECLKNNAKYVWNRSGRTLTVYENSYYGGRTQVIAGGEAQLLLDLYQNNASHSLATP